MCVSAKGWPSSPFFFQTISSTYFFFMMMIIKRRGLKKKRYAKQRLSIWDVVFSDFPPFFFNEYQNKKKRSS